MVAVLGEGHGIDPAHTERAYQRRWLILAVLCFSLLVIVLAYVFGTRREERSRSEEGENPIGSSEPSGWRR